LETLIAFSPYYRANYPCVYGEMEQFYTQVLGVCCKDFEYAAFHKYINRKVSGWYKRFPLNNETGEDKAGCGEECNIVKVGSLPAGALQSRSYYMFGSEDESGVAKAAAAGPVAAAGGTVEADATADAALPPAAAEAVTKA
jgi:hypothetical protein